MLSKTIERLKYLLLEYRFYFCSIALLLALSIYNYSETLAFRKEHARINKEVYLLQVTYERRQKAYE
jgi:predicted membrane-bound dolichyl-phosphate-mannose-protein mannosyltransferase